MAASSSLSRRTQDLFRHTDMKKQRKLLVQTLAVVVANIGRLEEVIPALLALGRRHAGYGVEVEHYATVGTALIWTWSRAWATRSPMTRVWPGSTPIAG